MAIPQKFSEIVASLDPNQNHADFLEELIQLRFADDPLMKHFCLHFVQEYRERQQAIEDLGTAWNKLLGTLGIELDDQQAA